MIFLTFKCNERFIDISYLQISMRKVEIKSKNLVIKEKILGFIENEVMTHGTSGRVSCPKRFIGKRAYIIIVDD